jgi:Intracellular proteinase inhibitor
MLRTITFLAVAVFTATGCGSMTAPSSAAPVRVTVQATPTFAGGPETATFTLRVENISSSVVDLTFPSSCQVLPYFVDRRTGQAITPRGGGFACATVITRQTLNAGESFSQVITVSAGDTPVAGRIVLPSGDYSIYARLEDSTYRIMSDQVPFSVK